MQVSVTNVMAFLVQEMRSARRSMRTWVFATVAVGLTFGLYVFFSGAHLFGQTSAPRLNVPGFGGLALLALLAGAFSLTFDSSHRDRRVRIADALDARPFSNFELHAGRLFAVAATVWLALAAVALLVLMLESWAAASLTDAPDHRLFGGMAEPGAGLVTFVLLDAPPALLFWGALAILLGSVLRHRMPTLLLAASLLAAYVVALFHTPLFLLPVFSGIANLGLAGSDMLPRAPGAADFMQRAATVVLALACLLLASGRQPRRDAPGPARWGALFAVAGLGTLGSLAWLAIDERAERSAWAAAHAAEGAARIDLEHVAGNVRIDPGRELAVSVDLHVVAKERLDVLVFSLNPAMRVGRLRVDGAAATYSHDLGLLEVVPSRSLSAGTRSVVHVEARGVPDHRFAYLDSAVDTAGRSMMDNPLALLGEQSSLFLPDYVALTPGVRWLPRPGANWGSDDMRDFHRIDLTVSLPPGWWPAGAGRTGASAPWRFRTTSPIPDFALFAAPFERRALTVASVDCELLVHPRHVRQFELLAAEVAETAVSDFLREALTTAGLEYPHRTLSVVEAPAQLRRYGGGWRMGTLQAWPGVQLLAEHGLPTARLRPPEGDVASVRAQGALLEWIDDRGANRIPLSAGFARNSLPFLAGAAGDGAFALDYLLEALTARVVLGAHTVAPASWLAAAVPSNSALEKGLVRATGTATVRSAWFENLPESVATRSEGMSLERIDPLGHSGDAGVLIHKGDQVATLMERVMGHQGTREFLALMRQRHAGGTFTKADFMAALRTVEPTLEPLVAHFFEQAALPGFLASEVRVVRIRDDKRGRPRYQISVDVRNDEQAPGLVAIGWRTETDGSPQWHEGPHAIVPGHESVEIGATSPAVPLEVRLETYASLNRGALRLPLPDFDRSAAAGPEALNGTRPSAWTPRRDGIVVDDLDTGFSVTAPTRSVFGWGRPSAEATPGARIPEYGAFYDGWRRLASPHAVAWGKYRRTIVRKRPGDGTALAHFDAVLPRTGRWRLAYHLPGGAVRHVRFGRLRGDRIGTLDIRLVVDGVETPLPLDGLEAETGWNDLGMFDLPAGHARVTVSDKTSGLVVADAIRWRRISGRRSESILTAVGDPRFPSRRYLPN